MKIKCNQAKLYTDFLLILNTLNQPHVLFLLVAFIFFSASMNVFAGLESTADKQSPTKVLEEKRSESSGNDQDKKNKQDEQSAKSFFANAAYEDFMEQKEEILFDESNLGESAVSTGSSADTDNKTIDAGAITLIQSTFLENLKKAFSVVSGYALNLLYLFAVLELAVFGMIWALQRDVGWDKLFFKIIKIGLIFFIIQNYAWLLDTIMQSFARIAGVVINNTAAAQYIFNPAKIWQYGYDFGIHLLQQSTIGNNFGMAMIQVSLGMGILLVFGLLGIQMVSQMISFYLVSLGSLILLPFGAFTLGRGMFDKAVQTVFQAGIRLMALIIIVGIAVVVWDGFKLTEVPKEFNINQPLGLFFTSLLFLCLAFYVPKILSQAVGSFNHDITDGSSPMPAVIPGSGVVFDSASSGSSDMRAATLIDSGAASSDGGYAGGGGVSAATATPVSVNVSPSGGSMEAKMAKETLAQASNISKSVSEHTVKKIKEAIMQAVKEKK